MNQLLHQDSNWYRAIILSERIEGLHSVHSEVLNGNLNLDRAQRQLLQWQSQSPFATEPYFVQRLAADGLNESEFLRILGEPIEAICDRLAETPAWLDSITQAFSQSDSNVLSFSPNGQETVHFLYLIEPIISQGVERLRAGIGDLIPLHSDLPFDSKSVEKLLFASLPEKLLMMLGRTMILELNVARLQGLLQADSANERFRSFIQRLQQPDIALSLLQEYPVLARQIVICIDQWVNYSLEFIQNLCADWEAIRAMFSPEADPGMLVQVVGGGDQHGGGRTVLIAKFSSGFQIVYKPKALAVSMHFQELLAWLNEHGDLSFRTVKVLERGRHGWVEFVTPQTCTSLEEIQRFYERQGGYLALLYALQATDFHLENLIAAGEHPVLIDLESLFHPYVDNIDITQSNMRASETMAYSVLRVGLLPERLWANPDSDGIEISGLGGAEGQLEPKAIPYWGDTPTDEMQVVRKQLPLLTALNRPTLNGEDVNVLDHVDAIVSGFTQVYQLLLKHRNDLLAINGPLARFANDEVRVILRATQTYGLLHQESFHPDVLRNALDRERLFDRLWISVPSQPNLAKVIPSERHDLWQGDIPMFTTHANSCDLWSSTSECIPDFFDDSGLTLVQRRVQQLSDTDLTRQLWFIRASLTTLAMEGGHAVWHVHRPIEPQRGASREQLLAIARDIGDKLELLALRGKSGVDATWIGLTFVNEKHWMLTPLGLDLYSGLPGVALFLAHLGVLTTEIRFTNLAQAALVTIQQQVEHEKSFVTSIGGFSGWGGLIYALSHLGVLWNRSDLLDEAEALVERLPDLIEKDAEFDIIGGAAGCIGALVSLHHCRPSKRTLAVAVQCGDWLIAQAQRLKHGTGWVGSGTESGKPLTGLSHGVAGIAFTLLELASLTGEERFRAVAVEALAYERSLFSPQHGNWPDLDSPDPLANEEKNSYSYMNAWCHGAPGIGLGRVQMLQNMDDAEIRAEIDTAIQTTLRHGFGMNHSLCHGSLGNLELLLQASLTLDNLELKTRTYRIAAGILNSMEEHGWQSGVPMGVETPGLMTGLAGIGYGLLRLAAPSRVPSVLTLEPPRL